MYTAIIINMAPYPHTHTHRWCDDSIFSVSGHLPVGYHYHHHHHWLYYRKLILFLSFLLRQTHINIPVDFVLFFVSNRIKLIIIIFHYKLYLYTAILCYRRLLFTRHFFSGYPIHGNRFLFSSFHSSIIHLFVEKMKWISWLWLLLLLSDCQSKKKIQVFFCFRGKFSHRKTTNQYHYIMEKMNQIKFGSNVNDQKKTTLPFGLWKSRKNTIIIYA